MSTETKLRTAMAEAVATSMPDADHLVSTARRQGLGIRRRRQALAGVGIAAALAVAVAAPLTIAGDRGTEQEQIAVGNDAPSFDSNQTSPITGRSNAAALLFAVGQEATGTATGFRGQASSADGIVETYAGFSFTPSGGDAAGDVGMNLSDIDPATQKTKQGEGPSAPRCEDFMENCQVTSLPGGSVLRTYEMHSQYGTHQGILRSAELLRTDHVRVLAFASNGDDITERDEQVNRTQPVLTTAQLVDVVTQPWWAAELPTYFAEQGDQLRPYNAIEGAAIAATPAAKP